MLRLAAKTPEPAAQLEGSTLDAPIELYVETIDDEPSGRTLLSRLIDQVDLDRGRCERAVRLHGRARRDHRSLSDRLAGTGITDLQDDPDVGQAKTEPGAFGVLDGRACVLA
jgi:hypothetical protein